jgi:hypothetical protein
MPSPNPKEASKESAPRRKPLPRLSKQSLQGSLMIGSHPKHSTLHTTSKLDTANSLQMLPSTHSLKILIKSGGTEKEDKLQE